MYMPTTLGEPQPTASCSGWENDPESFSKRVAEHYVRTVLGQSLRAKRIVPYWPKSKKGMEVIFSDDLAVGVSFVKIPDYVIALRLRAQPPGPPRYYTYACTPDGNLVLTERPKPSSDQKKSTNLRMRTGLGSWGGFGQPPSGKNQNSREALERYKRELNEATRTTPVVQAIRRLPEGQVCPAPEHIATFEQRIREKLQGAFSWDALEAGINLWRQSEGYPPNQARNQWPPMNTGPSMREISPGDVRRSIIHTARILEEKYLLAQRTGDHKGMVKAAEDYHKLLGSDLPKGPGEPMPGRGTMERQREQWAQLRDELQRNAPNLDRIVRHTGPLDMHRLRQRVPPPFPARTRR